MGNSLYGNVINPPKSFQNITGDKGNIQAENTNNSLTIKGDGNHIETSINGSKLTIKHISQPSEVGSEKVRDNPIIIQGGATDVKVVGIDSLKIDNKGHITNASVIKNYEIRPVGKEDRQENGDIGEIFNYYTVNRATGQNSHAEGSHTDASGIASHAEGYYTIVSGDYSHSEGRETCVNGICSHGEGYATYICPLDELPIEGAHAEGGETWVYGTYGHAEGWGSQAVKIGSHAEGDWSYADGDYSHAEGGSSASGEYAHSEGVNTSSDGRAAHAEGQSTIADGIGSHAEGNGTYAGDIADHAEGQGTQAYGKYSHAEGLDCIVEGEAGHAEGYSSYVYFAYGHAEGNSSYSDSEGAHAEGEGTYVDGRYAHGEGCSGAYGNYSHSEGYNTYAEGNYSHSGGQNSTANGLGSLAHGLNVITETPYSTAFGKFNEINNNALFQIGYGSSEEERKDIFRVLNTGLVQIPTNGIQAQDVVATKNNVKLSEMPIQVKDYDTYFTIQQGNSTPVSIIKPYNAMVNNAEIIEGNIVRLHVNGPNSEDIALDINLTDVLIDAQVTSSDTIKLEVIGEGEKQGYIQGSIINNSITTNLIQDKAITTSKISNEAITNELISSNIDGNKISNNSLSPNKIKGVIQGDKIDNLTITNNHLQGNITADKLAGGISKDQIISVYSKNLNGQITNDQLEGKITADKLNSDFYTNYIDTKLNKKDPIGSGSLSINRKANTDIGANSVAIGSGNTASGIVATTMGIGNVVSDNYSVGLGYYNKILSTGECNTALGNANSISDLVESDGTIHPIKTSVGIGYKNNIQASASVAIGYHNTVQWNKSNPGDGMIAIGYECLTEGWGGISEGYKTQSLGGYGAHSEGRGTIIKTPAGHAQGRYNLIDETGLYAHIVGNGEDDTVRSNAHTLDWAGNAWYAGTVETEAIILRSSTPGSTKKFALTVDDNGIVSVNELEETTV